MRLKRWGVEIYDLCPGQTGTLLLGRRFWTRWWATDYAAQCIKDRGPYASRNYSYRPVLVKDYLAAVKKSWGRP